MTTNHAKHSAGRQITSAKITRCSPDELVPYANNSRVHSLKQVGRIAQSINKFGFLGAILVDATNTIIAGHARVLAAKQIGLKSVPIICVDHLSDAERRAFIIADNRLSDLSSFDVEILATELTEIGLLDPELDLTVIGFDEDAIEIYLDAAGASGSDEPEVSPPADGQSITRLGDLWLLKDHKLLCADATQACSYLALMGRERAKLIVSDVPYNLKIKGFVSGNGKHKHREFVQASGEMSVEQFARFLTDALTLFARFSRDGSLHYIFIDHRHLFELITAGRAVYDEQLNLIVWKKTQPGLGSFYRSQHELILLFKKGTASHVNNVALGKHGRNRSNVWDYPGANSFSATREEELGWHSTVKPLALITDAIIDASRRGDIVLDGFGGSGTTLIAAEQTGRKARMIELDPGYCDVILRRFLKTTGTMPLLDSTGETFAEVEAARTADRGNA